MSYILHLREVPLLFLSAQARRPFFLTALFVLCFIKSAFVMLEFLLFLGSDSFFPEDLKAFLFLLRKNFYSKLKAVCLKFRL